MGQLWICVLQRIHGENKIWGMELEKRKKKFFGRGYFSEKAVQEKEEKREENST